MNARVGLDIGGANLKAFHPAGISQLVAFPLWKQPERLPEALRDLLKSLPTADALAVTMTGELCDCFSTKAEGVAFILDAVTACAGQAPVLVWGTTGTWFSPAEAKSAWNRVAAANWHALATWVARSYDSGLLIDVGSTTTDIIPFRQGRPIPTGLTDRDRLRTAELVYTGVARTPLCSLGMAGLAAEWFATTLDVYLVLGMIAEDAAKRDTADGRPATREAAHNRLAHQLCGDCTTVSWEDALALARACHSAQVERLALAAKMVATHLPDKVATVVVAGSGEFLARTVARQTFPTAQIESFGPFSHVACAYAVARLGI